MPSETVEIEAREHTEAREGAEKRFDAFKPRREHKV
jgi:hypothetical protein